MVRVCPAPREPEREERAPRAYAYRLLGALLARPPTRELLDLLRDVRPPQAEESGSLTTAWGQLERAARGAADLAALDDEFHALFIGVGRGEVLPYGSWYQSGLLMDRPLALLRQDLARLGIERQEQVREPEDHAAALCETMSLLVESTDIPFAVQRRFFTAHVGSWMGDFFRDLQHAEAARFYRAVGSFGACFLEFEQQYLEMPA